jgi:protein-disulfide isomerase
MSTITKRELREQRRAERQAAEAAEAARATRRRRAAMLGGAATLAAIVVAVAAIASSSGGTATPKVKRVESSLFAGIPERNGVLGDPKAKATVTEFLDLQCPICAEASKQTLPTLINDYVRTGKVKLEARTLHFIGPDSARAARAAAAAQEQGRLWPFVEAFYAAQGAENSGYVTDGYLRDVADAAGLDADKLLDAAKQPASQQGMAKADQEATRLKVDSTPTFTVTRDGKTSLIGSGVLDAAALRKAVGS